MAMMPATTPEFTAPSDCRSPLLAMARAAIASTEQRVMLLGAAGCATLLGLIFATNLIHFLHVWGTDDNYSHGFLVPLISLYFADQAARRGPVAVRAGVGLGLSLITFAILGRLATILVPVGFVGDLSFVVGLAGICALLFGTDVLRRYWFAFFFLIFMIPLPIALYTKIASPLQLTVSQIASVVLNSIGIPVLCEGNRMTLPGNVQMFVAEACSGMRQMTGFLALTAAVAYLAARPAWYRITVVASAIPIAMTANVLRVILTGIIMARFNSQYASGAYHTLEGLLMMGLGLSLLRAECWALEQFAAIFKAESPEATAQP
jgi:exosortase